MRYVLQKLGFYLVALWIAVTLNFALPRLMPGNPVDVILARIATRGQVEPATRRAIEAMLGGDTDQPIHVQYWQYLTSLVRGELGVSVSFFPESVSEVIASSLPWTVLLVGTATILSFVLAHIIAIFAGWNRGGILDTVAVPTSTVLQSVPYFWLALLLSWVFYSILGWLPRGGGFDATSVSPGWDAAFIGSAVNYAVLPAMTIVISSLGAGVLGMRNMMVSTMGEDYITTAQAKGLRPSRIMLLYGARNAILPSVSGFAMAIGFVVGGSVLTETVFAYPGIGTVLLNAVQASDYALMQGIFLIITVSVLAANFVVDMLYGVIDPRTRQHA